jgi:ribosomal protein L11 methyltransferase
MSVEAGKARVWYAVEGLSEMGAREAVEYALMEAGALGTESLDEKEGRVRVVGYFEALPERERVRAALLEALRLYALPSSSVSQMELREIADRDWLGEWKKSWQPVAVGERFLVAPPWSEIADGGGGRLVIRIEPGMAFGTGTHETTRLCLAAIEKYSGGSSFLDVGTGTGILAIAAAMLNPRARIEACDTDAEAIHIARENARANNVSERIAFRVGSIEETATASADLVCANLTADVIVPLLPALVNVSCGRLILSGILDSQAQWVTEHLHRLGITRPHEIAADGEWVAIIV